ncbi:hypothetical protein MMF93_22240 [Streptomyces tubbatahanensis]|uniref:Integral membrane protein n=1 Tax=Streptomyces tubbatahanensis TaxID=2923272 RepID=A0ABY3Y3V8_9ACTN|nr:hypothetical protein [Streptomyces tubbatahanensis]UNT01204.1 hypothetical protein MMF93_22240 [Streptomyces tubbatahanensis]
MDRDGTGEAAEAGAKVPGPRRIVAAAVVTGVEGVIVAAFGLFSLVLLVTGSPDDMVQAATLAVTVLALSVLPLAAARGLWRRRRWSRGPSMIVQLLALPVAWQMAQNGGGLIAAAAALALAAVAVLACLVNPKATEALGIDAR